MLDASRLKDLKDLKDLVKGRRAPTLDDLAQAQKLLRDLERWMHAVLPLKPDVVDVARYDDMVRYFVDERPVNGRIAKGAMLLLPYRDDQRLVQVFLDRDNNMLSDPDGKPYGRQLIVRSMDDELTRVFGDQELVIVE